MHIYIYIYILYYIYIYYIIYIYICALYIYTSILIHHINYKYYINHSAIFPRLHRRRVHRLEGEEFEAPAAPLQALLQRRVLRAAQGPGDLQGLQGLAGFTMFYPPKNRGKPMENHGKPMENHGKPWVFPGKIDGNIHENVGFKMI